MIQNDNTFYTTLIKSHDSRKALYSAIFRLCSSAAFALSFKNCQQYIRMKFSIQNFIYATITMWTKKTEHQTNNWKLETDNLLEMLEFRKTQDVLYMNVVADYYNIQGKS